ncbi:MAG: MFS transporter [Actinomycetota bacterium]
MAGPREPLVRRNTILLGVAQAALWGVLAIWVSTSPNHVRELAGERYWAGIAVAVYTLAAAAGALLGGRLMDRAGRKPGLSGGYALMLGASLMMSLSEHSLMWTLAATVALGFGAGAAHLGRGAVAEMYPPETRARWVGVVLLAGTVGAVGGAPLVNWLASAVGNEGHAAAVWLSAAGLAALGLAMVAALRPDPRDLAIDADLGSDRRARRSLRELFGQRPLRAALATVAVSQTAMTGIMGVSSVVVHDHGGTSTASAVVVSLHLGAMFAFSPLIGVFLDRVGRKPGLIAGGLVAIAGAVLGALAEGTVLFGAGLFLVGIGWSGAYLGATAVIADVTTAGERQGVLGVADLVTHGGSTLGALAGGFLLDTGGLMALGLVMGAILLPALALVAALREPSPGRWPLPESS